MIYDQEVSDRLTKTISDMLDYKSLLRGVFAYESSKRDESFWQQKILSTVDVESDAALNSDTLDRIEDNLVKELTIEEEKCLVQVLNSADNSIDCRNVSVFEAINKGRNKVEEKRLVVDKFLMSRKTFSILSQDKKAPNVIDPITQRELMLAGYVASYLGATIRVSTVGEASAIPDNVIYAIASPEYTGWMHHVNDLMIEPYVLQSLGKPEVRGYAAMEILAIGLTNPTAVCKITL